MEKFINTILCLKETQKGVKKGRDHDISTGGNERADLGGRGRKLREMAIKCKNS
jgi:hypothetical protein